jgi:hypothetical protein
MVQGVIGTINKDVFLSRVTMHIEESEDASILVRAFGYTFRVGDLRD